MATTRIPTRTEVETAMLAARRLTEFREMMQRFEYQPKVERIDEAQRLIDEVKADGAKIIDGLRDAVAHARGDGSAARVTDVPTTTLRNLDRAFGLVPLPKKREPKRQPPAISAEVYAAIVRFS